MSHCTVTFVIVNYKSAQKVEAAVSSVQRYCDRSYEIVVVDNSECPDEVSKLEGLLGSAVKVVAAPRNGGFGYGCNYGARFAAGDYLFFLNPDAELTSRCVSRMIGHLETESNVGAVGGRLIYPDGVEGHSYGAFISLRRPMQMMKGSTYAFRDHLVRRSTSRSPKHTIGGSVRTVDWCSGADLLMRTRDFHALGGFDETYFLYYEECDLQYRMREKLGLTAVIDGTVDVLHEDGGTGLETERKRRLIEEGCLHFMRDHRPPWHVGLYRVLTVGALALDATLQFMSFQFKQIPACVRLVTHVAKI